MNEITVRLIHDTKTGRYWFEEKQSADQWFQLNKTNMACEGNARHELLKEIDRRRKQHRAVLLNISKEETFSLE